MDTTSIIGVCAAAIALVGAGISLFQAKYARDAKAAAERSAEAAAEQAKHAKEANRIAQESLDLAKSSHIENLEVEAAAVDRGELCWVEVVVTNRGAVDANIQSVVAMLASGPSLSATPVLRGLNQHDSVVGRFPVKIVPRTSAYFRFIDQRRRGVIGFDYIDVDSLPAHEFDPDWRDASEILVETATQTFHESDEGWRSALRDKVTRARSTRPAAEPQQFTEPLSNVARRMLAELGRSPDAMMQVIHAMPGPVVRVRGVEFTKEYTRAELEPIEAAIASLENLCLIRPWGVASRDMHVYELTAAGRIRAGDIVGPTG